MAIREEVIKLEKSIILLAMSQSAIVVLYIAMNKFVQTLDKRLNCWHLRKDQQLLPRKFDMMVYPQCHATNNCTWLDSHKELLKVGEGVGICVCVHVCACVCHSICTCCVRTYIHAHTHTLN